MDQSEETAKHCRSGLLDE